jgi:4-diphosphocytidyl-2-C-methyl-D-erythritol kinase
MGYEARVARITVDAPAKVNTYLKVLRKRPDGYHDLEMVMVPLTLCDRISIEEIQDGVEFELIGEGDAGMRGADNLACRAARLFKEEFSIKAGVRIALEKNTPIAAGLGGGSSDAAAVLIALNKLWAAGLQPADLARLGKRLGADVPFFCFKGPAFVEGIGDKVTPYRSFPKLSFILINPGLAVSTKWVYGQLGFGLTENRSDDRVPPHFQVFSDVTAELYNDLEAVTIKAFPEIRTIKETLMGLGAGGALMSGSGPTVFGIFENEEERNSAASQIKNEKWKIFTAEGLLAEA